MSYSNPLTARLRVPGISSGSREPEPDQPLLAVPAAVRRFHVSHAGSLRQQDLERELHRLSVGSVVRLRSPKQILLDSQGRVQGDLRLTRSALSQLCTVLATGLNPFVTELAGRESEGGRARSVPLAIHVLNETIKLRFDSVLNGCRLILDRAAHRIEGVVGARYNYFSNADLYARCQSFVEQEQTQARFHEAILYGRWMLLRYKCPRHLFSLPTPVGKNEPFFLGWNFGNSEVGQCSLHFSPVLIRGWTGTASLAPPTRHTRLVHVRSARFNERLDHGFDRLRLWRNELSTARLIVESSQQRKLGLGSLEQTSQGWDEHLRRVQQQMLRLQRNGANERMARTIYGYLLEGTYRSERVDLGSEPWANNRLDLLPRFQDRSYYDLACAVSRVALAQLPDRRETLEQLAHRILVGQFTFS